jgi:formylglycine-generating enzyme required for sulfatase activity
MAQKPIEVFFSYSREDKPLRDKLEIALSSLKRHGVISSWHDRQILAGSEWKEEIDHHIKTADVILLLISPHFIASEYCYEIELPDAMARHDAGEACVVPILLRPVLAWKQFSFAKLQVYPSGGKPITKWTDEDDAFLDVAEGIQQAVDQLLEKRQQQEQELIQWLQRQELPLSSEAEAEAQRLLKLAGLTEANLENKIAEIVEARSQAAQQAAQEAEARRQAAQAAERQAEIDRQNRLQAEQAEQARKQAEAKRQARLAAEQQAEDQRKAEQARIRAEQVQREREEQARRNSHRSFTIALNKKGLFGKSIDLEMIAIPGGKFWMGSPDGVGGDDERPRHEVTIAPFFMGKYPITQAQYQAVMEKNPSRFKGENRPVEKVTWHDAIAFCQQLSKIGVHGVSPSENRQFRLPSEAEWEYACRSGTETAFYFGETISTEQANYDGNYTYGSGKKGKYREQTTDVGSFPRNEFGLYDMHGNVWEWCADHWHSNYNGAPIDGSAWVKNADEDTRLLRGGSWYLHPDCCRSASRDHYSPDRQSYRIGFRVVCV